MIKGIFVVLVLIFCTFTARAQGSAIKWQADYAAALTEAEKSGKPILLDFTAKWCAPCREMEKSFWTRPDVVEAVKSFVAVKIDYDAEKKLVNRFAVRGLPYIVFADQFGSLINFHRGSGNFDAAEIKRFYDRMPPDAAMLTEAFKHLKSKTDDGAALLEIADYYDKRNLPFAANQYYQLAYSAPAVQRDFSKKEFVGFKIAQTTYAVKDWYPAAARMEDYLKKFPAGANREILYSMLIDAYLKISNLNAAVKNLELLKAEFSDSKFAAEAARAIEELKKTKIDSSKP